MDRRERDADLSTAMLAALQGAQTEIWTALPGTVASDLNPGKRTVTVQPSIQAKAQNKDGSFSWVTLPVLPDVPVYFPEGGGVTLTFPVKAGDECLVVIASRCIDAWWQSGGVQVQADLRMHDLSDGFALVGVSSVPRVISAISTTRAQLRSNDGQAFVELDPQTHFVRARTVGKIELNADDDILVHSGTKVRVEAPAIEIEGTASILQKAPLISSFGSMSWVGYTGSGGTVGVTGMTVTFTNNTFAYNNNNIAYTGGTMTYNGHNITNTHTHSGVTTGGGVSGVVT